VDLVDLLTGGPAVFCELGRFQAGTECGLGAGMNTAPVLLLSSLLALAAGCTRTVRYEMPSRNAAADDGGRACVAACNRSTGDRFACYETCPGVKVTLDARCPAEPDGFARLTPTSPAGRPVCVTVTRTAQGRTVALILTGAAALGVAVLASELSEPWTFSGGYFGSGSDGLATTPDRSGLRGMGGPRTNASLSSPLAR
jgi:hypothetical protein